MKSQIPRSVTGLHTKTGLLQGLNLVKQGGHSPVPVQNFYKGQYQHCLLWHAFMKLFVTKVSKQMVL